MALTDAIDKVIDIVNNDATLKGVYFGDQVAYSSYPIACVGTGEDFLLGEKFPVIAAQSIHDEKYIIGIVIMVKFEDDLANAKSILTLTDTMRAALRADMKPPLSPLGGYCYQGSIGDSKYTTGAKGEIWLRISVTTIEYIKRII